MGAVDNMAARPGRAALTMLGTVLGTATFVAVLGITSTASQQISVAFNALVATQVTVTDHPPASGQAMSLPFPAGTEQRLDSLHGVRGAGISWASGPSDGTTLTQVTMLRPGLPQGSQPSYAAITAASPGYLSAVGARVTEGRLYGQWEQSNGQPVCVLGATEARQLGITDLSGQPAVYVGNTPVTVIGIIGGTTYQDQILSGMLVPPSLAAKLWGNPQPAINPASVFIATRLGAAAQVGQEAPYAINPLDPARYQVSVPPNPERALSDNVNRSLASLFYAIAGVTLLIGAAGIANITFTAVLERIKEIGLRRTFGAGRGHILLQFSAEATVLGLFGGVCGAAVGAWTVVIVAAAQQWTPVIHPATLLLAPLAGAATGLTAGLYPAWRASRVQPVEALRT